MTTRKFARDWLRPIDALTSERYVAGRSYALSPEIEAAAHAAGALEVKRDRSARRRGKSGSDAPEE